MMLMVVVVVEMNWCSRPCLWCYHQILEEAVKENLTARCPNCRKEYDQNKISMQHIDHEKYVLSGPRLVVLVVVLWWARGQGKKGNK